MYKNPWRGQIVLSPLYLELEFAALHTPGICCRGSISLACTAAFLQDWINSLLFIVQHPEKLCFMHSNNITSLWGQEKKLSNTLAVMVRPAFFSVMCRPWAQTELVQTPHVPSWLLLPNALEHSLPVCSLAVPCWQSSCGQGGNPAVWLACSLLGCRVAERREPDLSTGSLLPVSSHVKEQQLLCGAEAGQLLGGVVLDTEPC